MRILVIGGTHFIGKAIVKCAIDAGYEVTLFNRGLSDPNQPSPVIIGDVEHLVDFKDRLLTLQPHVVVHCIAYTPKHAEDFVSIFQGTESRLIVLSSMDCYEVFQQLVRGKETSDFPVHEDMPLSSISYYWRGTGHKGGENYDKNLMTDILIQAFEKECIQPTLFRLPMVYGPEDRQYGSRHGSLIRRIYDEKKTYVIGAAKQSTIWTYGFVDNMAEAIVYSFNQPQTIGKIYNIGETTVRTWRRWAELYAEQAGMEFEFQVIPDEWLTPDPQIRNHPPQHLIFDCTRYAMDTGFKASISLQEAIQRTLEYGLSHPDHLGNIPHYEKEKHVYQVYTKTLEPY